MSILSRIKRLDSKNGQKHIKLVVMHEDETQQQALARQGLNEQRIIPVFIWTDEMEL